MKQSNKDKPTVFVTGANGFIGQHVVSYLAQRGFMVAAAMRRGTLPAFSLHPNIQICYADLTDKRSLMECVPKHAVIVNLAANPYHKTHSYTVNVLGTADLLDVAKKKSSQKFIQISSQATKIKQKGVYGKTKLAADELVHNAGLPYLILKPSLVYGPGEKGLFAKVSQLSKKLPAIPVFGDGKTELYPIHVQDFCQLLEKLILDDSAKNQTFDMGGKDAVTYNQLYQSITQFQPKQTRLLHLPTWVGLLLAKATSFLPNPPFYEDNVLGSTQDTNCQPLPLLKRYKHQPISFKTGISEIFQPNKIRVGIIGLGKMGMLHATILQTFSNVEVVALIDINPLLYSTFQTMGIPGKFYQNLELALAKQKLDAVYITTPTFTHSALLKLALKHNLHVFIEKPVALNQKDLDELRALKNQKVIHAGYTLLYHRPFFELFKIIQDKKYGKPLSYEASFEHGEVLSPKKGWMFQKKTAGGGVLMNPGPHLFALVNLYFGQPTNIEGEVKKIYSDDVEDEALFEFDHQGFSGNISLSWSKKGKHIAQYRVKCQFSSAVVTATNSEIKIEQKGKKTQTFSFWQLSHPLQDIFNINPDAYGEAYALEDLAFIQAVQSSGQINVPNTLGFALNTESMIQECYRQGS